MENNKEILIVEDDPSMQSLLREAFESEGFMVMTASDGEEAIRKVEKVRVNIILLDIVLPKKDGFEVLQHIRMQEFLKNIPVILLTNLEQSEDIERALSLGATTYLVKSNYKLQEIVEKVRSLA
jgi:DNA-binding response OmpR family regulator